MSKLEILSALFITFAAGYWYLNPTTNMEPIIIMASSGFILLGSFVSRVSKNKASANIEPKPVSIKVLSNEIRCFHEDVDYGVKLDLEIYINKKSLIKSIELKYKEPHPFGENQSQRSNIFYINATKDNLLNLELDKMVKTLKESDPMVALPKTFEDKSLIQATIAGYIPGKRVQDGWEGVTLHNWTLVVQLDDSEVITTPITFIPHEKSLKKPIEWREVGFINA